MSQFAALSIASRLIRRPSVTPDDGGCQDYIESLLAPLGFVRSRVDAAGVSNSIYARAGELPGALAFAGHTDVVPAGPLEAWPHPPFDAVLEDGVLHGRGARDMKGSLACWIAAVAALRDECVPMPAMQLLITSDEEGDSVDGSIRIVEHLQAIGSLPDAAIVGEPSCKECVGDTVRRGRRGVVQIRALFHGQQGHSAYPQDAENAIHLAVPILAKIAALDWGEPADGFPATSCQITNVNGGTGATNMIPGCCEALIDIRYNPGNSFEQIKRAVENACAGASASLDFDHVASAFSTACGPLLDLVCNSIRAVTGVNARLDTGGGTSDGRFLAAAGIPVAELGLTNSTIHQAGECVPVHELELLTKIYAHIIKHYETCPHDS
jgi:succinyl-diaminopimelate desuccinylase